MKTQIAYGTPAMGCYLDQSYRNSDSHNAAVVSLAMGFGYVPDRETLNVLAREENKCLCETGSQSDSELLNACADEAESWLNEQETRPFMYWANDGDAGAFGLWCNVEGAKEDCGFISGGDDASPQDGDYPADDYRGEWLHVTDHGNATLYVREDAPNGPQSLCAGPYFDREIWSVV